MKIIFSPEAIAAAEAIDVWKTELNNARAQIKSLSDAVAIQGNRITQATIYMQKLIADYPVIMGKELSHVINILEENKP